MDQTQPLVRISVRSLVEFILRSGDIDNRKAAADKDAMLLGGQIHRRIQRQMGAAYQAEVALRYEIPCRGFLIFLEGRADGLIRRPEGAVIDEIKGVMKNLEHFDEPVPVHLAQAKCYAYMYATQQALPEVGVQMTYCHMETEQIKRFQFVYDTKDLERWFYELIGQYEKWARYQVEWKKKRNASIQNVEFPFAYREGQKKLVASVYRTILRKKKLFIQAPTGVGKTIATVFPAVRAMGEGLGEKIFYLTARTTARMAAWQAFDTLKDQALRMKVLTLTAKEKMCLCDEVNCNPDACPYAKGHFDRVNDAVYELLTSTDEISRETLLSQAKKRRVCPHEMSLDVSSWVDAVICDYNYVFDPNAHLRRFFGEGVRGDYLFLIDEAHNLVERGREMYSAVLYKEDFLKIKKLIKAADPKLARKLGACNQAFLALKRECEDYRIYESVSHIYVKLLALLAGMERFLDEPLEQNTLDETLRREFLDFYFAVRAFLSVYEHLDENYRIYSELHKDGRFSLRLFCVNPAANLKEYLDKGNSAVFFSATLLPIHYYKTLLSTEKDDYAVYAESPFDPARRLVLMGTDVSTRYTRRGEEMYRRYAAYILRMAQSKEGNYLAFFPSYRFMDEVYEAFLNLVETTAQTGIECVMQSQSMSESSREEFLKQFEQERSGTLVGFCVMGGVFSEGIDLSGERLIGALIAGTGLPQVCRERELLKDFFDRKGLRGFDYAYLYPGMNKVLQAAGRVIRAEDDRGAILLLDERFRERRVKEIFPREWRDVQTCTLDTAKERLGSFWKESERAALTSPDIDDKI